MISSIFNIESKEDRRQVALETPRHPEENYRLFSVQDYMQLFERGILKPDERTELINGKVRTMLPAGIPHSQIVVKLVELIHDVVPRKEWCVYAQNTIEVAGNLPEPDLCIAQGPSQRYDHRRPQAEDVSMIIEVAETSLHYDRGEKLRLYAAAGIKKYWIINLVDSQVETYCEPMPATENSPPNYRTRRIILKDEVAEIGFTESLKLSFQLADLLPAPPAS
jgi:Uncharacterized protein conserved in cyanobacteria